MLKKLLFLALALSFANMLFSQGLAEGWKFSGHSQIRGELDSKDFNFKSPMNSFTLMKTRLGVEKTFENNFKFFVQMQDSRVWGMEGATLTDTKNVDLHQGYVEMGNLFNSDFSLTVGRKEISYGSQRVIGPNGWNNVSRAFDGVNVKYKSEGFWIDAFRYTINAQNNLAVGYPYTSKMDVTYSLYGLWANIAMSPKTKLDVYGLYDADLTKVGVDNKYEKYTAGVTYWGNYGELSTTVDAIYQGGTYTAAANTPLDISAYLITFKLQYDAKPFTTSIHADIHSGTSAEEIAKGKDAKYQIFDAPHGSKHIFYGGMDYFNTSANNMVEYGLMDIYLRLIHKEADSPFSAQLDAHYFMSQNPYTIAGEEKSDLGIEFDLLLNYQVAKGIGFELGNCVMLPGEVTKNINYVNVNDKNTPKFWNISDDIGYFGYLMLRANF